ncbi:hypothetical protein EJ08DRAFT_676207 [Tothia fuscella]|uniref:Uncharacterized protein n=1 Tax=Tothia fuscella TaxID=1048955 RepID=A0A9P4P032_9PEZI|nr:hypothetical protein EJ08DRAFT_676207 [Tothia fuscella]
MKLNFVLYGLSTLFSAARAVQFSLRAGKYEAVLFYDAYKMEFKSGKKPFKMAAGCVGSLQNGMCDFDEFLGHTHMDGYKTGQEPHAKTEYPNNAIAQGLRKTSGYQGTWKLKALHSDLDATSSWGTVFDKMKGSISLSRAEMKDPGKADLIKIELDQVGDYSEQIVAARKEDNSDGITRYIKGDGTGLGKYENSKGFKISWVETTQNFAGRSWVTLDFAATSAAALAAGARPLQIASFNDFFNDIFGTAPLSGNPQEVREKNKIRNKLNIIHEAESMMLEVKKSC